MCIYVIVAIQKEAMNHHVNKKDGVPNYDDEVAVISDSEGDDINSIGEDEGEPCPILLPSEVWANVLHC